MGNSDKKRQREAEEEPAGRGESAAQTPDPPSKKARLDSHRQLFVRSLPPDATSESLVEFFSQHYPVKHATVVIDPKTKTSRGYGFVSFADPDDAAEAKEKLKNELFHGRRLQLDIALPRIRDASKVDPEVVHKTVEEKRKRELELELARKPSKLIIRNLPWTIKKPDQLAKLFQGFGKIKFADLPNDKGKLAGFGFVTFRKRKHAQRAIEAMNEKVVDGRTLAVDWAVDRQTWEKLKGSVDQDEAQAKSPKEKKSGKAKGEKKEEDEDDDDPNMTQEDRDLVNFFKNYGDNLEDEEDEEDEENDEQESGEDDEEESHGEEDQDEDNESGSEEEEDDDDDDDEDEDSVSDDEESYTSDDEEDKKSKKPLTDNSTTIFVRNLPYSTTDETLKAHFTRFGRVRYARVVIDRTTEKPAGTGFVCFAREEDFKACLKGAPQHKPAPKLAKHSVLQDETADPEGNYTIDGRVLQVTHAVSKDEAARLAEESKGRRKEDKRRLFLLSEGAITPKSPLYSKLTPAEIKLREASAKQRKKLIESNPSLHLSLTRLAVRNIPRNLSSKDLKALARQAIVGFAKDVKEGRRLPLSKEEKERGGEADREAERHRREKGKGVVRQAKIVFEAPQGSKVSEKTTGAKSRGYGFIEYWSHPRALMGLRYLNGHPLKNEAGKTQRLIVEFAIENAKVVQRRRQQEERSRMAKEQKKNAAGGPSKDGKGMAKGKKGDDKKEKGKDKEQQDAGQSSSKGKGPKGRDGKDGKGGGKPGKGAKAGKGGGKKNEVETQATAQPNNNNNNNNNSKQAKKRADEKLALRTKIIARKRMMRKKKRVMRAGKR